MQATFKVQLDDAKNFQKVWTYRGVAIPLPSEAANFATDFANIVLRNFIQMMQEQAKAQQPIEEKKLIIEG